MIAYVIQNNPIDSSNYTPLNITSSYEYSYARYCGFNNCPADELPPASSSPTQLSVYILLGLLVLLCFIGMAIAALFMDDIEIKEQNTDKKTEPEQENILRKFKEEFQNLFSLLQHLDIYLLFPLSFFTGFELTFMWNEYNRVIILNINLLKVFYQLTF